MYIATFTVTAGGTDVDAGSTVPVANLVLTDTATNASAAYSASITQASDSIDANYPTVSSVSSSTSDGSYNAGDTIAVTVTFNEIVNVSNTPQLLLDMVGTDRQANYASGDGNVTLTFDYVVQPGDTSADLDYTSVNALTLNGGTIKDASGNVAILTLAAPGAADSLGANKNIIIDTTAPTVTGVSSSTADGSYKEGDLVVVQVTFLEAVIVDGTPQITLETGATDRTVNYSSGSGTAVLDFNYTVQADDTSDNLDYNGTNGLALNGGSIKDAAGNDANLTLATPGEENSISDNQSIVIDTTVPTLTSVTIASNNANTTMAKVDDNVTITFTASETIQSSPTVTIDGNPADSVTNTTGNDWTASRVMKTGDTQQVIAFAINFVDTAGNSGVQVTAVIDGSSVTFDETAPVISAVDPASSNKVNDNLVSYTLSETIATGTVTWTWVSGTSDVNHTQTMASGELANGAHEDVNVTTPPTLVDGAVYDISFNGIDLAGNAATTVSSTGVTYDITAPTVISVVSNVATPGVYAEDDTVVITFSEAMDPETITGTVDDELVITDKTWGGTSSVAWTVDNTVATITIGTSPTIASGDIITYAGVTDVAENAVVVTSTLVSGLHLYGDAGGKWNFISTPKALATGSKYASDVFSDVSYSTLYRYNAYTNHFDSICNHVSCDLNSTTTEIKPLVGYWIEVTVEKNIEFTYLASGYTTPPAVELYAGWNAIGYTGATNGINTAQVLQSVNSNYSTVIGWDASSQAYETSQINNGSAVKDAGTSTDSTMTSFQGYWIWMTADDTLSAISA